MSDPILTSATVAQARGRKGIGLELNPAYARLASGNLRRGIELVADALGVGNGANGSNGAHGVQELLEGAV